MGDAPDGFATDSSAGDPLEAGLRAAFGPDSTAHAAGAAESVLAVLERDCGVRSHLRLRDVPSENEIPSIPRQEDAQRGMGRYIVAGEIARGGAGVVLMAHDTDLGREVAIKTLRDEHDGKPAMIRRLVEEAQIGGQLQHPGILPIYEIGLDAGNRPFFAMKLVRGQSLASLLNARTDPATAHERRRFLTVFEQIAQTVAYAHARGVIHRDLKPLNVMVGAFGEVQVVDWGLAKVFGRGDVRDETAVDTIRSSARGSHSEIGAVIGTLPYMAPEQARGEVDTLDERCDVFALGAILCEILTGSPPFEGSRSELMRRAAEGRLEEAFSRLETCGADADLVRIARSCLAPDRDTRPRDGREVARQVAAYLVSADERVRSAEMDAALARAKLGAERKARRWTAAAGVLTLAVILVSGGAYIQAVRTRVHTERARVAAERDRVVRLQKTLALLGTVDLKGIWMIDQARSASDANAAKWAEALALTAQAVRQTLALETDEATRRRAVDRLAQLEAAEASARARAQKHPEESRGEK